MKLSKIQICRGLKQIQMLNLVTTPNDPFSYIADVLANAKKAYMTSPYVKDGFVRRMYPYLKLIPDVKMIARLTSYELATNSVDVSALDLIAKIGEVRCLNTLHAKSIVTDVKAYVGSLNFTNAAFSRNYELGVVSNDQQILQDLERFFVNSWEKAIPYQDVRDRITLDQVTLETVGWEKVKEWWDIISNLDMSQYNEQVRNIVLLPMPKPPLNRVNMLVRQCVEVCLEYSHTEVVMFSELYGPIPLRFSDDFGKSGEYFFDEPAENFYTGKKLTREGHKAARVLADFLTCNAHQCCYVAPLPDNYKRITFLKAAEKYPKVKIITPKITDQFIGYVKRTQSGACDFLRKELI